MADYPTLTSTDLSDFSGRPVVSYGSFATQALLQAKLLFKMGTCLAGLPDDQDSQDIARLAILAMADSIILAQPYQGALASPFSSETIGSYSYNKVARAAQYGLETGIMWFDLAVARLSVCDFTDGISHGGGIEVFENRGHFANGSPGHRSDNVAFLGPDELNLMRGFGFDPAPGYNSAVGGGPTGGDEVTSVPGDDGYFEDH